MGYKIEGNLISPQILLEHRASFGILEMNRRLRFLEQIIKHGLSTNTTNDEIIQKARIINIADARYLHSLSFPYRNANFIGSVALEEQTDSVTMTDIHDSNYTVHNAAGNIYWRRHFYPFGSNDKQPQYALDTVYLAFADMLGVVEFADNEANPPQFIRSTSNPTMANFVRNSLQFHLSGAVEVNRTKDSRYEHVGVVPDDEVEMVFQEQVAIKDSLSAYDTDRTHILFDQFITLDEILRPEYRRYLEDMKQSVYQHALATGRTQASDADDYEKEIRIRASLVNLRDLYSKMTEETEREKELQVILDELENKQRELTERLAFLRARYGLPEH